MAGITGGRSQGYREFEFLWVQRFAITRDVEMTIQETLEQAASASPPTQGHKGVIGMGTGASSAVLTQR